MVSPGELRFIAALYDSDNICEPTIKEGTVEYPLAKDLLDDTDLPVLDTFDSLVNRNVLEKIYTTKAYICPSCHLYGRMNYIRACGTCGSTHTTGRIVASHPECGYSGPANEFEREDGSRVCAGCTTPVKTAELEYEEKHICRDCDSMFSQSRHCIQCRVCQTIYLPKQVLERSLYEYQLTDHGRAWYQIQMMTRDAVTDRLESQEFDTTVDFTISTDTETYPVVVYAEREVLTERIIVGIYDNLTSSDINYLQTAAQHAGAHPLIVLTTRSIPETLLRSIRDQEMSLLTVQPDGTLGREYTTVKSSHTQKIDKI